MIFVSAPVSANVTISGTVTPNFWGYESNNTCNCGLRYEVLRWSVAQGGIVSSLGISTDDGLTEWGTSAAVRTAPAITSPTSTNFAIGDRIILVVYNDDGNGVTQAAARWWYLDINGAASSDGDSYLSFTETITFSADSNNGRAIPMISLLRPLLYWWKQYFDKVLS